MDLARILELCPEVEVSEWLPDLEAAGNGADPAPLHDPVPARGPDAVPVQPEAGQQDIVAPPATGGEAQEKPRRPRKVVQAARAESRNGNGAPDLASVFLTIPDAARLFHMHPGSVWRLVCEGRLPGVKLGNKVLLPAESVQQFIAARKLKPRGWAVQKRNARSSGSMLDLA